MDQMQPLSDDEEIQLMYDDTIHVSVSGTVVSVSKETNSFWIKATQYISGQYDHVAVHGHMDKNRKWKQPVSVLPSANSIIAFDGILDRFESYTPADTTDELTCIVVNIEDITFLQPRPDKKTSGNKSARERIKIRKQKRKVTSSAEFASTADVTEMPSGPSTSQTTLGKHQASSSDDIDNPSL